MTVEACADRHAPTALVSIAHHDSAGRRHKSRCGATERITIDAAGNLIRSCLQGQHIVGFINSLGGQRAPTSTPAVPSIGPVPASDLYPSCASTARRGDSELMATVSVRVALSGRSSVLPFPFPRADVSIAFTETVTRAPARITPLLAALSRHLTALS